MEALETQPQNLNPLLEKPLKEAEQEAIQSRHQGSQGLFHSDRAAENCRLLIVPIRALETHGSPISKMSVEIRTNTEKD